MNFFKRLFRKKKKCLDGNIDSPKQYNHRHFVLNNRDDPSPAAGYVPPVIANDYTFQNDVSDHATHFDGGSFGGGGANGSWSDDSGNSGSYDSGSSDSGSTDTGSSDSGSSDSASSGSD